MVMLKIPKFVSDRLQEIATTSWVLTMSEGFVWTVPQYTELWKAFPYSLLSLGLGCCNGGLPRQLSIDAEGLDHHFRITPLHTQGGCYSCGNVDK